MSSQAEQQPQQIDGLWIERYDTVSKIAHYPAVNSVLEYSKGWYNYAKEYPVIKFGLDTVENVVDNAKPIVEKFDGVILPLDKFSSKQLERAEYTVGNLKDRIISSTETVVNTTDSKLNSIVGFSSEKLQNTPINTLVSKTGEYLSPLINNVVDSVLPPQENEDLDHLDEKDLYEMEKRSKILLKLRKRINMTSVGKLPSNSINSLLSLYPLGKNDSISLRSSVHYLIETSYNIQNVAINKSNELTKTAIDGVYSSLESLSGVVGSVVLYAKRFESSEAIISINELLSMVKTSKDEVLKIGNTGEKIQRVRDDASRILDNASTLLKEQVITYYDKIGSKLKKTDSLLLSQTVESINELTTRVLAYLNIKPSISSDSNGPKSNSDITEVSSSTTHSS